MAEDRLSRLKRALVIIGELAAALAIVAFFFAIFVGIYSISFPDATGLGGFLRDTGPGSGGELNFEMDGQPEDASFTALLSSVHHTVKVKAAEGIVWSNAEPGAQLYDRHAVQSYARSGATISFGKGGRLRLGENSLVVIRENRRAARSHRRTSTIVLLDGALHGELSPTSDERLTLDIAGATSTLRVDSDSDRMTEFKVTANPDDFSNLEVYNGNASLL